MTALNDYICLGRSGLRVSRLSLGTMTFGDDWGWGADDEVSRSMFDAYAERGGNFVDTANFYTRGSSERLVGQFAANKRDSVVIATKYSLSTQDGNPNASGNHRRNMVRSVEASLRRMSTDYIDLLYLHIWDDLTPVEEILRGFDDLVRTGKIIYAGISDTPAWQVARMQTIADLRGWAPLIALQIEYSLVERTVERELLPMARELGLGVTAWSPLAKGVLTGKYGRNDLAPLVPNEARGTRASVVRRIGILNDRTLEIAEVVKTIAVQVERSPAQVALAWLLARNIPIIPIIGARTLEQFIDNLNALDLVLDAEQVKQLDAASHISLGFPHEFLQRNHQNLLGGNSVTRL